MKQKLKSILLIDDDEPTNFSAVYLLKMRTVRKIYKLQRAAKEH